MNDSYEKLLFLLIPLFLLFCYYEDYWVKIFEKFEKVWLLFYFKFRKPISKLKLLTFNFGEISEKRFSLLSNKGELEICPLNLKWLSNLPYFGLFGILFCKILNH